MGKQKKHFKTPDQVAFADMVKASGLKPAEVARRIGLTRASVSRILSGAQNPSEMVMIALRREVQSEKPAEHVFSQEPRAFSVPAKSDRKKHFRAPVVSWASAGIGGNFSDLAEHLDEFVETDCTDPNCYALIVEGKSMEPELRAGDRIVVAPNMEARTGDVVVARLAESGQVFLKVLEFLKSGRVKLSSYNKDFREIELAREEFRFIQPVYGLANRRLKR